jgi:hypothetical protein
MTIAFDVNDAALRREFFEHLFLEAIAALDEHEPQRWGGLSAQHMVEHLVWSFEQSTGRGLVE